MSRPKRQNGDLPETNYFEVPAIWTDLTCGVTSAAVILAVEYFFRHTWGWHRNQDATRPVWMTVEEVAAGRRDRGGERYDDGTGYTVRSVRPALEEAVKQDWLVWRIDERTGRKQYALHLFDAAVRALNAARSPVSGQPPDLCLFTGDAVDNAQRNEFAWFLQIMHGGEVDPNSGAASFDGYPSDEELAALLAANRPFTAPGLAVPWYALPGNHDILALGAFPITEKLNSVVTSDQRINSPPLFQPSRVPADSRRAFVPANDLPALFGPHMPVLYYAVDLPPASGGNTRGAIRLICLDTCNRGAGPANTGGGHGSLDPAQFAWLEEQIAAAPGLVVVAGHHQLSDPNWGLCRPDADKSTGRVVLADQVVVLLTRYPQVVAYLCGHGHRHRITPHPGFWEIETASSFDPPHQSRLIELFDNDDGTLSLLCTVIDPAPSPIADHARAIARADPQCRHLSGMPQDRDVELLLSMPW